MECSIKQSSLQLTGCCDKHTRTYTTLYTCQKQLHKLSSLLEATNNTHFINNLVQTRLNKEHSSGNVVFSNWKIKTKCSHLREGDYNWISKISHLQNIHLATSELLNWLSTLGGGWSALGDSSQFAAEQCFTVSVQQLSLAHKLQYPELMSTCWLYAALSLIQLNRRKEAKQIILSQFPTVMRFKNHRYLTSLYSATVFKYNATADLNLK